MTRTNVTGGRGETLPEAVVESPARGRSRARPRGHARGTTIARGRGCEAAPVRVHAREDQVPPELVVTPLLQNTLLRVLMC